MCNVTLYFLTVILPPPHEYVCETRLEPNKLTAKIFRWRGEAATPALYNTLINCCTNMNENPFLDVDGLFFICLFFTVCNCRMAYII